MDTPFETIQELISGVFLGISEYLAYFQTDSIFDDEELEVLDDLRTLLADLITISWLFWPLQTLNATKIVENVDKVAQYFSILLDLVDSYGPRVELPSKRNFKEFEWIDEYSKFSASFRKAKLRNRVILKEMRDAVLPNLLETIVGQLNTVQRELLENNEIQKSDFVFLSCMHFELLIEVEIPSPINFELILDHLNKTKQIKNFPEVSNYITKQMGKLAVFTKLLNYEEEIFDELFDSENRSN